ncbi:MAG: amidohydrolase [Bacteroidota bacterium]
MKIIVISFFLFIPFFFSGCIHMKEKADLIITNGTIYTADSTNSHCSSMAVRDGKILETGASDKILHRYRASETIDLEGKALFPGFIDAHCHFFGYAEGLLYIDLDGAASFAEVLNRLKVQAAPGAQGWIVGRGWDQNLWDTREFPDNEQLNKLFSAVPVMLIRVDGHVVLANQEALNRAGIGLNNKFGQGQVGVKTGRLTGILSETAADAMRASVPRPAGKELVSLLKKAQERCFAVGLTCVSDAGLDFSQVMAIDSLQKSGILKMQVYAMLTPNPENISKFLMKGLFITDKLVVRSIKLYADGSLGSRTARLKKPYSDAPGTSGLIVTKSDSIIALCKLAYNHGYQVNTHCIGDSANKMVLQLYGAFLKGKNDLRWRIEHAQVVDREDIHFFGDYSVVPSVQATHATSDMYWAGRRLGSERIKGAYAYKTLKEQNGWLANGTDFPIENISPLFTFYAAVGRMDQKGYPGGGFQADEALSRADALRSVTCWAAKADFLEKRKGSLETGKDADFVVLDQDIMEIPVREIPGVKVLRTYIGGKEVFRK